MTHQEKESGDFIGHRPCVKCDSRDALSLYEQSDGSVTGYCFSCQSFVGADELDSEIIDMEPVSSGSKPKMTIEEVQEFNHRGWKERKINLKVSEKYGVRCKETEDGDVTHRYYPVTEHGQLVGYKCRRLPKDFYSIGRVKKTSELFGQQVFEAGGKYLVITTGEEDAMALASVLHKESNGQEFWTPVVSVTCGDGSIIDQLKCNFEYINSFEKVVLMFDMDESAQRYVKDAAKLLKPGSAHIAKLPMKDAAEMVKHGRRGELKAAFWNAERFSPVDVCTLGQLWEHFEQFQDAQIIPLPPEFTDLTELMGGGPAFGEITVLGALTSVGKSTYLNKIVLHAAIKHNVKTGLLYLESDPKEQVQNLLSIYIENNLALKKPQELDMKALKVQFDEMIGDDQRIVTINHNGSFTTVEEMYGKIEWLIKAAGCRLVVLDPLQCAVPSNENNVIDQFMDRLLKLAKQTGAGIIVVSHMKKPDDDKPHGVSEYSLKGSSSINQVAFNTILMSRDKTHADDRIRNTTKFTLVKCRRTGMTGHAGWMNYDPYTMRVKQIKDPYAQFELDELESAEEVEETSESY